MNVQNPETKDKNTVENEEGVKPDLALEKVRLLTAGKIKFEDIKDEELLKEIHERFTIEKEEIPETPEEKKEEPEAKVADKEVEENSRTEEEEQIFLQDRKSKLDELNTIDQRIKSSNNELERINGLKTKKTKTKYEDPLTEDAINNLNDRLNQFEERESRYYSDKSEDAEKDSKSLKQEQLLLQLQVFQGDNGLKMSKPLKTIDAQYKRFLDDVGGVEIAGKFLSDDKFRAQKESEGVSFPISEKDFDKYNTLVKVQQFKQNGNYPTFSSAYADYSVENGSVQDKIKQAVLDATTETVEKMTTSQNTATTLSPDDGGGSKGNADMTKDDMANFLMNFPDNPTPAQEKKARLINELLKQKKG